MHAFPNRGAHGIFEAYNKTFKIHSVKSAQLIDWTLICRLCVIHMR